MQRRKSVRTLTTSGLLSSSELMLGMATASLSLSMNWPCRLSTCLKKGSRCDILSNGLYR